MTCPLCGSDQHRRYRSPKVRRGVILRRHVCLSCSHVFLSAEYVVESLDQLEAMQK